MIESSLVPYQPFARSKVTPPVTDLLEECRLDGLGCSFLSDRDLRIEYTQPEVTRERGRDYVRFRVDGTHFCCNKCHALFGKHG